ncbi:MAG: CMP-N-acetylneuraminic acid synthetase [Salibacteraceae bacterium]|jgi:CMP-N-acetylneuraminic acid synthetase
MKVAALLTGRGNNTLKDKNILPVLGKPLLTYPAMAAKRVDAISSFYISSDDDEILCAAEGCGYQKIVRPKELATPDAKHIDTIFHAVNYLQEYSGFRPDILVVLLANSATVKSEWIEEGIRLITEDPSISAAVPVYKEQDHHPFRAKRLNSEGNLDTFFDFKDQEVSTNRQELEPCYFLCHNFWVLNLQKSLFAEGGQKPWVFLGNKTKPILVEESFDVHTEYDILRSERWLRANNIA